MKYHDQDCGPCLKCSVHFPSSYQEIATELVNSKQHLQHADFAVAVIFCLQIQRMSCFTYLFSHTEEKEHERFRKKLHWFTNVPRHSPCLSITNFEHKLKTI